MAASVEMDSSDEDVICIDENDPRTSSTTMTPSKNTTPAKATNKTKKRGGSDANKTPIKKRKLTTTPVNQKQLDDARELKRQKNETIIEAKKQRGEAKEKREEAEEEKRKAREEAEEEKRKAKDAKDEAKRLRELEREEKRAEKAAIKEAKERIEQAEKEKADRCRASFAGYFVKLPTPEPTKLGWCNEIFKPYELRKSASLASQQHRAPMSEAAYNALMKIHVEKSDYLTRVSKMKRPRIVKDPLRAKLFQFLYEHRNTDRPPYYGTWRRISRVIRGRRPFAKSEEELAYDVDSEAEWEEERADAGDDCDSDTGQGSGGKKEKNELDILDDEFYVGHGYLSDSEGDSMNASGHSKAGADKRRAGEFKKLRSNKNKRASKVLRANIYGLHWNSAQTKLPKKLRANLKSAVILNLSDDV